MAENSLSTLVPIASIGMRGWRRSVIYEKMNDGIFRGTVALLCWEIFVLLITLITASQIVMRSKNIILGRPKGRNEIHLFVGHRKLSVIWDTWMLVMELDPCTLRSEWRYTLIHPRQQHSKFFYSGEGILGYWMNDIEYHRPIGDYRLGWPCWFSNPVGCVAFVNCQSKTGF